MNFSIISVTSLPPGPQSFLHTGLLLHYVVLILPLTIMRNVRITLGLLKQTCQAPPWRL